MNLKEIRNMIEDSLEQLFRTMFFWTRDDRTLGLWISYIHIGIAAGICLFVLTYRIFRPPFWVIVTMLVFVVLLFLQHVILRTCLLSRIERRLMGEGGWFINDALCFMGIPTTRETVLGATIICSGLCMGVLVSEVVGELWNAF